MKKEKAVGGYTHGLLFSHKSARGFVEKAWQWIPKN